MAGAHLTRMEANTSVIWATCDEHGRQGDMHTLSRHGMNAAILDARAHDAMVHGVKRTDRQYRDTLAGLIIQVYQATPCPTCGALAGQPCQDPALGDDDRRMHPARVLAVQGR
jgi:hypothetical protein